MLVIRTLLILLLLGWTSLSSGQSFSFSGFQNVQVRVNDEPLANPFSGSYNSGQFWPCDLDNDGTDDLLVYDKSGRKVLTFMSKMVGGNPSWVYNPDYEDMVPPIESWLSTADFNCDGKQDIFTQTSAGIKVYRNASSGIGQAAFVLEVDGLMSQGFNGPINIQVNPYGAPAFSDVDSDGDLDILCFDFSGNTVEYHKNLATVCGDFQFKKDSCVFGRFATKPACGQIRLNTGCEGQRPAGGGDDEEQIAVAARIQHIGSQLSALDLDGDGDKDLLVGDLSCSLLNRLINGGSALDAVITEADTLFPSASQYVRVNVFPSAYQLDANQDGKDDLVITPTFFSNYSDGFVNNSKVGTHLYLNQSTGIVPDFQLIEKDFIQNQTIEIGEEAIPAFADVDADGDQDLFVGHLGIKNGAILKSSVYFYRNTGSSTLPEFTLVSTDYMGLSTLSLKRIRPLFHDFNNDGAIDFAWIASPGTIQTDSTRLYFLLNQSSAGQPVSLPALSQRQVFPFAFTLYDCPVFTDIDGDSKADMLVAKYTGKIQYYRQVNPWPSLSYQLVNSNYGNIARAPFATNPVLALGDVDLNGQPDLLVGDFTGSLKGYRDFKIQPTTGFPVDSNTFYNQVYASRIHHSWGNFVSPALADLNADGYPDLAVGLSGGGLNLLVNRLGPNAVKDREFVSLWSVYPNPLSGNRFLKWKGPLPDGFELYDPLGRKILESSVVTEEGIGMPSGLPAGLYHFVLHKSGKRQVFHLSMNTYE